MLLAVGRESVARTSDVCRGSRRVSVQELQVEWLRLPEVLVAEVSCTHLDGGRHLRQPAKFLRWRLDREPTSCRFSISA